MENEQSQKAITMLAEVYAEGMEKALKETLPMLIEGDHEGAGHMVQSAYMAMVAETILLTLAAPSFWREVVDGFEAVEEMPNDYDQVMAKMEEEVRSVR